MEHYLKIDKNGSVISGKKKTDASEIEYDESKIFNDFEEGYEWLNKKFGIEKREIQYIHQLDL